MASLIWRQHRLQLLATAALLAAGALAALISSVPIRSAYHRDALSSCLPPTSRAGCDLIISRFESEFSFSTAIAQVLISLPALVALFVGAPLLAREFEHRTHRLAWTQSQTRQRWLSVKLLYLGTATVAAAALVAAVTMWWRGPFDALQGRISPESFDIEGLVVPAYALFGLAIGALAGLLLRRTIPAMCVALAVFVAVRAAVEDILRPRLLSPLKLAVPGLDPPLLPRDWIVRDSLVTSTGRNVTSALQDSAVVHAQKAQLDAQTYMASLGWRRVVSFQPDSRFWTFQAIEAGIFVVLALTVIGLLLVLVRRTPS